MSRYALPEMERRFLLAAPPDGLSGGISIYDRYLTGTRLRLRRMEPGRDGPIDRKLGQKVRPDAADPTRVLLTNLYLTEAEYEVLARLPADELRKTRHRWVVNGRVVGLDVFEGHLSGLVMAEADFESEGSMATFEPPPATVAEVSQDDRFSGGSLAALAPDAVDPLLAEFFDPPPRRWGRA